MIKKHHRLKKTLLIILLVVIILVGLVIAFISPITKYLVEKHDIKYLGREVTMNWAYVNPFTGYVHFDKLNIMEEKNDSVFLSASGLSINFEMLKMLSKTYEISGLTLSDPKIMVKHGKDNIFNFSDLIKKFSKEDEPEEEKKEPVKFNILDVAIKNGEISYDETFTPVLYSVKKLNIEWSGKYWNADTMSIKYAFSSGVGTGDVEGIMYMNAATSDYRMSTVVKKFDLVPFEQYLKTMMNYGQFRAILDAAVSATGNLKDARNINAKGIISISDFHFGKNEKEDFASFEKFTIDVIQLNPKMKKYLMDSVSLIHPYFKYEKYDELDNIQKMFGEKGENVKAAAASKDEQFNLVIEIADYVKLLAKNFFKSNYKVGRLAIYSADIRYHDYSQSEKFAVALNPLNIYADSLNSNKERVALTITSGIKPYGSLNVKLGINPKDSSDFDINYNIEKINAAVLNPFLITATTFPLDRGSIAVRGNWVVKNGEIKSSNRVLVIDPRITKRVRMDDNTWLPLRFAMFFVRERGNAIDYDVPITGNLKDPKFHLRDVIFDVISNIFVKPATTLYRAEVKTVEMEIEKNLAMNWETSSPKLLPDQENFAEGLADFLKEHPQSSINVTPMMYADKEKEYILMFEAKKKYWLQSNNRKNSEFSEDDSIEVFKMSAKDTLFTQYLQKQTRNTMLFTSQAKAEALVGSDLILRKYEQLKKKREEVFMTYFKEEGVADRVKIRSSKEEVPFNGFSYYKISYNGELPEDVKEAFYKLNELDNKKPREKLKEERKKTRRLFNKGN
ncbi:MAG: hypothetical protein K0S44_1412 [Bacteroidetes bacterium]|jgi:hypothetical protein|nr:hypothetical protein [Bacteroidota bacterium]